MKYILAAILLLASFPAFAHSESDVSAYCEDANRAISDGERQPNGKKADPAVMSLKPGYYLRQDGASIEIFEKNYYLYVLAPKEFKRYGTEGDDLMNSSDSRSVGGCSLAQLSELIGRNNLKITDFKPAKKKKKGLK